MGAVIAITGATGHLGNALLRALVSLPERPEPVRAVVRPGRDVAVCFGGLEVEVAEADIRDIGALTRAFAGAELVYHLAGIVTITRERYRRLHEVNVEGTRNVITACRAAGVRRLVYTSSVHAFVEPPRGVCIDERTLVDPDQVHFPYSRTKAEATRLVQAAAQDSLDAVVVFPSGVVGPFDFKPSATGRLLMELARGRIKAWVDGGYNFVDVRDVAEGIVAAGRRGRCGEGYVLSGNETSVRDLFQTVAELTGTPAPHLHVNMRLLRTLSPLIPAYYWATRQQPLFTTMSLEVVCSNCEMSSAKARRELGFSPRPLRDTLADTLAWFQGQGVLP
jgi:dihydroflavonol-4-reductase